MSKRMQDTAPAVSTDSGWVDVPPPPDPFGGVAFESPMLQLVQASLRPFLKHGFSCPEGEGCTCGLLAAVRDLERREMLVKRYGTVDG